MWSLAWHRNQQFDEPETKFLKSGWIVLAIIFVDDTVFIGNYDVCKEVLEKMNKEFEMSMFGEVKFFVGPQIQ